MHLIFYLRGIHQQVDFWKTLAQGLSWKWIRRNVKTGKDETFIVQGALRPSVLGAYEYIFPEECLAEVLSVMGITRDGQTGSDDKFKDKIRLATLRKIFRAKKIPKKIFKEVKKTPASITLSNSWRALSHLHIPGVAIHPIGIKKDDRRLFPEAGYIQEAL